ncbi:MAG TPA: D-cysteine desulfhydrase family protein [Methylomirabilota bacterium]|jgi:D-cysteine desulfhydrase|nr:D-cysteine desulfhydrase family protein [Methylomirabilota bacterium]
MVARLPARLRLAYGPTPIEPLPRLGARLGLDLYVKRDDLTGFAESGNKVRKLEFLVREALDQDADTLITVGALQSNCCRATAAVAAKLGLKCVLGLRGDRPAEADGNLLLARLFGAEAVFVPPAEVDQPDALFTRLAEQVRRRGGRPYIIPESGSNELGVLGYAAVVEELQAQIAAGAPPPEAVVIAAWSGGSLAGLYLGKALFGLRAEVWGVPIAFEAEAIRDYVWTTVRKAGSRFSLDVALERDAIRLLDGYQGQGRAGARAEELAIVAEAARADGLLLDPVYTAKAFLALADVARRTPGRLGRRVLFLHTGGGFGVFPFRAPLTRLLDEGTAPPS